MTTTTLTTEPARSGFFATTFRTLVFPLVLLTVTPPLVLAFWATIVHLDGSLLRMLSVDGALTLTRPLYRNFYGGIGVWGGAQPGLYRIDAGPRLSYRVRDNIKVHLDYRQRLAGNALPGSGPVVTLAADF